LVLALCASAQESRASRPTLAAAVLRLESREPVEIARGACHARDLGAERLLPYLRAALAMLRARDDDREARFAALQVLDALCATTFVPEHEEVEPWLGWEWTRPAVLALLARAPARHANRFAELFAELDPRADDHEWLLAGNVLATARAPGFARDVLERLELRLTVQVVDRAPTRPGLVASGRIRSCCETIDVPDGFPIPPCLELETGSEGDPDRLALAGVPLCLKRGVADRRVVYMPFGSRLPRPTEARLCWISALLGVTSASLDLVPHAKTSVAWTDAAGLLSELHAARARIAGRFAAVVDRLRAARVLAPDEAAKVVLRLDLSIDDRRADRSTPLPKL
jgi:hypothetical protein